MPIEFDPILWNPESLGLTQDQTICLPQLKGVLVKSKSPIAGALQHRKPLDWTSADMRVLESELTKSIEGIRKLRDVLDALAKVVRFYHTLAPCNCSLPRSATTLRLETNPFHGDVAASERLINHLSQFLTKSARNLPETPAAGEDSVLARKIAILGVLSSVIHLHLLHKSMLIALVEALADQKNTLIRANDNGYVWNLSLAWQGEHDAELRMFIPDQLTGALLGRVKEAEFRHIFVAGLDRSRPLLQRHKTIYSLLENGVRELLKNEGFDQKTDLNRILRAAGTVAYLRMPAITAAQRSRKLVNHSARTQVMLRIFRGIRVEDGLERSADRDLCGSETGEAEKEIADKTKVEPIRWYEDMRAAFHSGTDAQVEKALLQVQATAAQPGPRFVGFALKLLPKYSIRNVRRHSLLVAKRCACRIGNIDPATLPIGDLEDAYRDALDDDWDDGQADVADQTTQRNKRATIQAIAGFHRYLRSINGANVPELEELAPRLKLRGLLHVDANFITIDEYLLVLDFISGSKGPDDPYLKDVLRFIVTLAFRCGLRRAEVLYLLEDDLDTADHLHVRNNKFREGKTRHSIRSLPAALLIPKEELRELKRFIKERKENVPSGPTEDSGTASKEGSGTSASAGSNTPSAAPTASSEASTDRLLFSSKGNASIPLDPKWLVNQIHDLMRLALKDRTLKLHHLRHSFATLLAAKLLPNTTSFARTFLVRHPKTIKWLEDREDFRAQLFGTPDIRSLDITAVAHLLGHAGPATSVEHYIHSLDWFQLPVRLDD
jgi:integrase